MYLKSDNDVIELRVGTSNKLNCFQRKNINHMTSVCQIILKIVNA